MSKLRIEGQSMEELSYDHLTNLLVDGNISSGDIPEILGDAIGRLSETQWQELLLLVAQSTSEKVTEVAALQYEERQARMAVTDLKVIIERERSRVKRLKIEKGAYLEVIRDLSDRCFKCDDCLIHGGNDG